MNSNRTIRVRNLGATGCHQQFTERDRNILRFLWKWKLASTATIHEAVGRPLSEYSTYKTLERLERFKLVKSERTLDPTFWSWVLTDRGFSTIRAGLGALSEEGYGSENHWHDRNVLAFQLGEWATTKLPIVEHFTEQELRRRNPENYPDWVPKTNEHRPDGYTQIQTIAGKIVVAYEVELFPKALSLYESTMRFYQLMKHVDRIYWLVAEPSIKEQILRARDCIRERSTNYHVFVDLAEYMEVGWDAMIVNECSQKLETIRENMRRICGDSYGELLGNMSGQSRVTVHYDSRKVLGKKRT